MRKNRLFHKITSLLLSMVMILTFLPAGVLNAAAADGPLSVISDSKKADPSTLDGWKAYFGPNKMDTEFAGAVWTDKSVFASATEELPGATLTDGNNFLVALSAIAANLSITGHTSSPTDTMLVLDLSGSMVDETYEVGTVRRNYFNYETVDGIDMSLIEAMIQSTNATIHKLMTQNSNNRVGVVLYSGNTNANQDATPSTATVVLPLGRYAGIDGEYLAVDTTWTTSTLYTRSNWSWQEVGEATYVEEGTQVSVSVKNGLKTEAGANVTDNAKQVIGGTYVQNGLYKAMDQFLKVNDTVVPEGKPQAGAERLPVIVLMSDGAPTIATTAFNNIGDSNTGDGTQTSDIITFLTQLTAAYVKGRVAAKYQESSSDDQEVLFLTLGLGTENSSAATNTLYPAGSGSTLVGYWDTYLDANAGADVSIISGLNGLRVYRDAAVSAMNYVDKYFYASNAEDLINTFNEVVSEIAIKAEAYTTLVEGAGADFSGYVTFEDVLGEMMHVTDMKGLLMSDGNGGTMLYTGKNLAQGITSGNLGTLDNPTARGDELVRTVRERITGTTTTQAQQLINNAYLDQQLYYADENNWSNYIGWYSDADGNYVGFWDKDSGYENAPADAVYANRSYGYLGVNGDSDMMHAVVMVRTDLQTLGQSVQFKIPAALLPAVQYRITLDENDPSVVDEFTQETAQPMRLVFEVGLRQDINSVNLEQKIAEHEEKGGHVHRNADGTVTFYTNEWAIGNDTNGNGIPDPEEVTTAKVAQSHFHPALDNSRFYYTDHTPILNANGSAITGTTRPAGSGYFYDRHIYSPSGRQTIRTPISATTLANEAEYDTASRSWYIPAGTTYRELARFQTTKTENATNTLGYSFFPAVFDNIAKQDVFTFLGNNGKITVAPAQGIALTKTISEASEEPGAPEEFTFVVTLSQAVANPAITDTNGAPLADVATVDGNKITVTLQAGQTVVISGIPTGVTYTVEEVATSYYTASSTNASGTVAAYTVHAVDFVNTAKGYGNLVVSKAVNYPQGFAPGAAHNQKAFTIAVTFTGDITGMVAPQNAAVEGNTFTLTLRDGQSATFANIPEGVTYTVTEDGVPGGYALEDVRYSDETKTIEGHDLDEVSVVNSYTLEGVSPKVKIQGDKTLVTNESSWGGESFTVELLRIDNFADEDPVSTGLTATMTQDDPHYEIDLSSIEFNAAGTYYFRAVEVIPEDRNENIAYDRTFGLFSITVGDADADGKLEIQNVNAYQNTYLSEDGENGWILEKDFTNVVTTDRIYLNIQKHVVDAATGETVDAHMGDITFGLFSVMRYDSSVAPNYYALTDTQGQATLMIPITKEFLQENGLDGRLVYFLREIAPAVENRVVGMDYDESWLYAISIMWNDEENKAQVSYAPIEDGQVGTYAVYEESFTFEHTNTYERNVSVNIDLTGSKTLNGGTDLGGREFSFSLYRASAAFVPGERIATVTNSGNTIAFRNVTFTAPGVYYLVAQEDATTLGGITVDATEYHITVEVEKYSDANGTTRLRLVDGYPTVIAYGTSENVGASGLNFNNRYTVTGSGSVAIGGKKILNGRELIAQEFQIGLYTDAACTQLLQTTANLADGTFSFAPITYTVEDLGEDYAAKTYTYYVKEIPGSKAGVTYDDTVHTVTVTVAHQDGQLTVTPSGNATTLQINNTYTAKPVDVTISGSKVLSGDWTSVENKQFTFQLFQTNANFVIGQTPIRTATVTGNANFSIGLHYEDGQEGIYYYVLKEDTSAQAGGVGYDAGEYHITVNVADSGDGQLVAMTTMYRPGTGNTTSAVFTNTYTVESTTLTLEGTKTYINAANEEPLELEEGMFSFMVLEGADLENAAMVATGYNLADGTIRFTPIRYTAAGVHTYSIVELPGDMGGVVYDDTVCTVQVTVVDNGDGTLTATADYGETPVAFENVYIPESAQVTFRGVKAFSGNWDAIAAANKIFTFELFETGADFVIGDTVKSYTENKDDGSFSFAALTFDKEGTYYFVIRERSGAADKGIVYDSKEICITVVVEDNGAGKLIPTVTCSDTDAIITADQANSCLVTVEGLQFTNIYQPKPVQYTPTAQKIFEGAEMAEFEFVLSLDGDDMQTKKNDAQGNIVFDTLTFEDAGQYEIQIRETVLLWQQIRFDRNVYTVILQVKDDGNGQLFIDENEILVTSENGRDNLVFRNAHHDVITKKDVFAVSAPTVSIDGKTVEKGDVLLYKIYFTNFDNVPVDITISDVIPQYTTYVAGSADNGGTLTGNTLNWSLNDVQPDATVFVSFQVKVVDTNITVINSATVLEGENEYNTNEVQNPVEEDTLEKDVFKPSAPTVSIDGQTVKKDDELLYTITYTNSDDFAAEVTITDTIPQYTVYVEGSADNGATFKNGMLTWKLTLDAGESKTVSFRVKANAYEVTINNQAKAVEGENELASNVVTNKTPKPPMTPPTGDWTDLSMQTMLLGGSALAMVILLAVLLLDKRKKAENE